MDREQRPPETSALGEGRARDSGALPSVETPDHFWPSVLNLDEAAAFLRVSANKLRALATNGEVPAARVGSAWRFSTQALRDFLADTAPKATHDSLAREHPGQPRDTPAAADAGPVDADAAADIPAVSDDPRPARG